MQVLGALKLVDEPVSAMVSRIVTDLRVPRMLLCADRAGLAMVGALLQTTTRNDLADPFFVRAILRRVSGAVLRDHPFCDRLGVLTLPYRRLLGVFRHSSNAVVSF